MQGLGIMKVWLRGEDMDFHAFLIKYAEIGIKGKNRYLFEDALCKQIRRSLVRLLCIGFGDILYSCDLTQERL